MTLKLVEFPKQQKVDRQMIDDLKKVFKEITEAAETGTLTQFILQGDVIQNDGIADTVCLVWSEDKDMDRLIGFAERLKLRLAGSIYEIGMDDNPDPNEDA
jgi:hypothetical protein